jgi:hypothetical protein
MQGVKIMNPKGMICSVTVLFFFGLAVSGTEVKAACSNANLSGKYLIGGAGERKSLLNLITHSIELDGYVRLDGGGAGTYKIERQQDDTKLAELTGTVAYAIGSNCEGTLTLKGAGFEGPANNLVYSTDADTAPGPAPELVLEDVATGHNMTLIAMLVNGTCPATLPAFSVALAGGGGIGATQKSGIFELTFNGDGTFTGDGTETVGTTHKADTITSGAYQFSPADCTLALQFNLNGIRQSTVAFLSFSLTTPPPAPVAHFAFSVAGELFGF